MKDIIREYSGGVLAVAAGVMIVMLILSELGLVGRSSGAPSKNTPFVNAAWSVSGEGGRALISDIGDLKAKETASAGKEYSFNELYSFDGGDIRESRIISVRDRYGMDVTPVVCRGGRLCFEEGGIYLVKACVWNEDGISSLRKVNIGVKG